MPWLARAGRLALAVALLAAPGAAMGGEVRGAIAANFLAATRRLAPEFQRASGHRLVASFASTGTLYAQIRQGAPFDVLLAADVRRPARLEHEGLGVEGTRFTYAVGRLALWSATPGRAGDGEAVLRGGAFQHLAIANPRTAPYGAAAEQVLRHLGLWDALQERLVQGQDIAQTQQFVVSGNAELGFVALAQLLAGHPAARPVAGRDYWLPPAHWYVPISQQALLLRHGQANPAARAFLAFLRSPAARAEITALGYGSD